MDWNDRLNRADKAGGFTMKDKAMANEWDTCAVGERAVTLNRHPVDDPSPAIKRLGLRLQRAVENDHYVGARRFFLLIQRWGARRPRREASA